MRRNGLIFLLAVILSSCEGTTFQNSVPVYPVGAVVDTRTVFVNFKPTNLNAYITVNREGYKENGKFVLPLGAMDAYGYGGIVVYVSMYGYVAYDLACPHCASLGKRRPCEMDGIYAVCPECGEQYELASGYALPQKGITRETLRPLSINGHNEPLNGSPDKLIISQRK